MVNLTTAIEAARDPEVGTANCQDQRSDFGALASQIECAAGRVLAIIEKRALIRDCLRRCFAQASDLDVVAFSNVDEWLAQAPTTNAALVILSLPDTSCSPSAQSDLARLLQQGPHTRLVIVLSDGDDLEEIVGVLNSGARGYTPTSLPMDVATEAVRFVRAGGIFVPASSLVGARRTREAATSPARPASNTNAIFTARQAAVVDALRRGKANKVIAYELKMRESTVKVHVRNIMKKLNAKNCTEVAFMTTELINRDNGHAPAQAR